MTSVSKIGPRIILRHCFGLLFLVSALLATNPLRASEAGQLLASPMSTSEKQNADDKVKSFDQFLNMKMTYAAFVWVLAEPLSEKKVQNRFDFAYNSEKQQLNVLFAVWQQLLALGKYKNTFEIFYVLKKYYPYFAKHMDVFLSLTSKNPKMILPYSRNTFLASVLISEREMSDPYARTEKIINDIGWLILTPEFQFRNNETNLGALMLEVIAQADVTSADSLSGLAKKIREQKIFLTSVKLLSVVKDFYEYGGARLASIALTKPGQYFREMILGSAAMVAKKNPMATALTISSGLHALFFLQQKELAAVLQPMPNAESQFYSVKQMQVLKVVQVLAKSGDLLLSLERDKTVGFSRPSVTDLPELKQMMTAADLYLKGQNYNFDFLNFFIQAEKQKNIEGFRSEDTQTYDLIIALADKLKEDVNKISKTGNVQSVEQLRKLLIDKYLHLYKRDNPSLLTVFLGWGGNCVARTMLFISLLKRYPELLPPGANLYFGLYLDHMEPIMAYRGKYYLLMTGTVVEKTHAILYHSNDLIRITMGNLKSVKGQSAKGVLADIPRSYFLNAVNFSLDGQIPWSAETVYQEFAEQKTDLSVSAFGNSLARNSEEDSGKSSKKNKKEDKDCLQLVYSPDLSGNAVVSEYPFEVVSGLCLTVKVMDFDVYIEFLKKESQLRADPIKFLIGQYNHYIYEAYMDSEVFNYFKNHFVNFDFINEGQSSEALRKKIQLFSSVRANAFGFVNTINYQKNGTVFFSSRSSFVDTYEYKSYVSLFSSKLDFNFYFIKQSSNAKIYSDGFLQAEKNNTHFFKKFMANVLTQPFYFARRAMLASSIEQLLIKRIFRVTEFGYQSFQESLKDDDGDLASEFYYLAAPAHEVRNKIDHMGQGAVDLTSDNEIQLAQVESAQSWRWGKVESKTVRANRGGGAEKVQQNDLIGMMIFMQSGLQFWNQETVLRYMQILNEKPITQQQTMMEFIFHNYYRLHSNRLNLLSLRSEDLQVFVDRYLDNQKKIATKVGGFKVVTKDPLNNPLPIDVYSVE